MQSRTSTQQFFHKRNGDKNFEHQELSNLDALKNPKLSIYERLNILIALGKTHHVNLEVGNTDVNAITEKLHRILVRLNPWNHGLIRDLFASMEGIISRLNPTQMTVLVDYINQQKETYEDFRISLYHLLEENTDGGRVFRLMVSKILPQLKPKVAHSSSLSKSQPYLNLEEVMVDIHKNTAAFYQAKSEMYFLADDEYSESFVKEANNLTKHYYSRNSFYLRQIIKLIPTLTHDDIQATLSLALEGLQIPHFENNFAALDLINSLIDFLPQSSISSTIDSIIFALNNINSEAQHKVMDVLKSFLPRASFDYKEKIIYEIKNKIHPNNDDCIAAILCLQDCLPYLDVFLIAKAEGAIIHFLQRGASQKSKSELLTLPPAIFTSVAGRMSKVEMQNILDVLIKRYMEDNIVATLNVLAALAPAFTLEHAESIMNFLINYLLDYDWKTRAASAKVMNAMTLTAKESQPILDNFIRLIKNSLDGNDIAKCNSASLIQASLTLIPTATDQQCCELNAIIMQHLSEPEEYSIINSSESRVHSTLRALSLLLPKLDKTEFNGYVEIVFNLLKSDNHDVRVMAESVLSQMFTSNKCEIGIFKNLLGNSSSISLKRFVNWYEKLNPILAPSVEQDFSMKSPRV